MVSNYIITVVVILSLCYFSMGSISYPIMKLNNKSGISKKDLPVVPQDIGIQTKTSTKPISSLQPKKIAGKIHVSQVTRHNTRTTSLVNKPMNKTNSYSTEKSINGNLSNMLHMPQTGPIHNITKKSVPIKNIIAFPEPKVISKRTTHFDPSNINSRHPFALNRLNPLPRPKDGLHTRWLPHSLVSPSSISRPIPLQRPRLYPESAGNFEWPSAIQRLHHSVERPHLINKPQILPNLAAENFEQPPGIQTPRYSVVKPHPIKKPKNLPNLKGNFEWPSAIQRLHHPVVQPHPINKPQISPTLTGNFEWPSAIKRLHNSAVQQHPINKPQISPTLTGNFEWPSAIKRLHSSAVEQHPVNKPHILPSSAENFKWPSAIQPHRYPVVKPHPIRQPLLHPGIKDSHQWAKNMHSTSNSNFRQPLPIEQPFFTGSNDPFQWLRNTHTIPRPVIQKLLPKQQPQHSESNEYFPHHNIEQLMPLLIPDLTGTSQQTNKYKVSNHAMGKPLPIKQPMLFPESNGLYDDVNTISYYPHHDFQKILSILKPDLESSIGFFNNPNENKEHNTTRLKPMPIKHILHPKLTGLSKSKTMKTAARKNITSPVKKFRQSTTSHSQKKNSKSSLTIGDLPQKIIKKLIPLPGPGESYLYKKDPNKVFLIEVRRFKIMFHKGNISIWEDGAAHTMDHVPVKI